MLLFLFNSYSSKTKQIMSSLNEILHACKYGDLNFIKNKFRNFTKNEIESLNDDSKAR